MNRRQALLLVGAAVLVGLVIGALWLSRGHDEAPLIPIMGGGEDEATVVGSVTLYYPGGDGRLHAETRALDTNADALDRIPVWMPGRIGVESRAASYGGSTA